MWFSQAEVMRSKIRFLIENVLYFMGVRGLSNIKNFKNQFGCDVINKNMIKKRIKSVFNGSDDDALKDNETKYKPCVLAIAKHEEKYLNEWIDYHLDLGFERIFIIDNNPYGFELKLYNEKVTVIPYNGVNFTVFNQNQCDAYNYAMSYIKNTGYNIVSVIDIDEFITFTNGGLNDIIDKTFKKGYNIVKMFWKVYDDNNLIYNSELEGDSVLTNFTHPVDKKVEIEYMNETRLIKSMFLVSDFNGFDKDPHSPRIINLKEEYLKKNDAFIKHFRTKNLESYIIEKIMKRGGDIANFTNHGNDIASAYFKFNKFTEKKRKAFIDISVSNGYSLSPSDINYLCREKHSNSYRILVYTYLIGGYANNTLFSSLLSNLKSYLDFDFDFLLITDNKKEFAEHKDVKIIEVESKTFPTIKEFKDWALSIKFQLLQDNFKNWDDYTHVMFVNSNLRFKTNVDYDFFFDEYKPGNRIIGTTHFMSRRSPDYLQASFWFSEVNFLKEILCPYIEKSWKKDESCGIVADWHDETYYNRFYNSHRDLWHVVDGYSVFELIDKTKIIGREWDVHYNDLIYGQDPLTHKIMDVIIGDSSFKNKEILNNLVSDGFNHFKLYDLVNMSVVDRNCKLIKSTDMYFYHLKYDFVDSSDMLDICEKLLSKNKSEVKYLIYAKKA